MTEPSVETAEGRQVYRDIWGARLSPRLSEALDALDARDKALAEARAAAIEECAKVALVHRGSAAKKRQEKAKLPKMSPDTMNEILAEERGEDIAVEIIAAAIRALRDPGA